jgi:ATP-dependent RNA helicase RhlE
MPEAVRALARSLQRNPLEVRVGPVATPAPRVEQAVLFVARPDKPRLLAHLLADQEVTRALVFTRTRRGADRLARQVTCAGGIDVIHGNRSQAQRERALERFRGGRTRVLIATDVAARGIDVHGVSHVVNFDLPDDCESYVHRIGRTGRAAATGVALSLCAAEERAQLARIERLIRVAIPVRREHPFRQSAASASPMRRTPSSIARSSSAA